MKVIHESASELRLRNRPSRREALHQLIWSFLFAGFPLFLLILLIRDFGVVTLRCDRHPQTNLISCKQRKSRYMGLWPSSQQFEQVTGATWKSVKNYGPTFNTFSETKYVVMLETDQGKQVFVEDNSLAIANESAEVIKIAAQANRFFASTQSEFQYRSDNRSQFDVLGLAGVLSLFVSIGLGFLYFVLQSEDLIFQRDLGQLRRQRLTLLGPRWQRLSLGQVSGVEVRHRTGSQDLGNGMSRSVSYYQVKLLPKTLRTKLVLTTHDPGHAAFIREKIQAFLDA